MRLRGGERIKSEISLAKIFRHGPMAMGHGRFPAKLWRATWVMLLVLGYYYSLSLVSYLLQAFFSSFGNFNGPIHNFGAVGISAGFGRWEEHHAVVKAQLTHHTHHIHFPWLMVPTLLPCCPFDPASPCACGVVWLQNASLLSLTSLHTIWIRTKLSYLIICAIKFRNLQF